MKKESIISFTGDIGFDSYMDRRWNDPELISDEIKEFLSGSDHVAVNVEGAMISDEIKAANESRSRLFHSIDPEASVVLREINADIWNLANNHIMDIGGIGLEATLAEAERFGAKTVGAGMNLTEAKKPVIIDEAGGIGMFGIGYQRACRKASDTEPGCFSWSDDEGIRETINEIKSRCRWCVVISHGGEEFTSLPSPYTRDRYIKILDMGADLIVGHHPHVPMNYEIVNGKYIFYSLGNFIFDTDYQRIQYNTDIGIVLKIRFLENEYRFEAIGIRINRGNETIEKGALPDIFVNVEEDEYRKLMPLSVKAFMDATKKQQRYLYPDRFADADDRIWEESFMDPKRGGRVPGEALDFHILCPLAAEAEKGEWRNSKLEGVKKYILDQIDQPK